MTEASGLTRAQRERARRDRNRRQELGAAGAALLLGVVVAFATSPRGSASPRAASGAPHPSTTVVPARTVLVVHYDHARHVDLAALVGVAAGGRSGSFVFVPPPTVVDVPALELQPIGSLLELGDHSLLLDVIENTTGVRVDQVALLDDNALARAFAAVPSLDVTFPHAVTVADSGGTLSYPAGRVRGISPAQGVRLLVDRESAGTLTHLATVQAVLEAYYGALRAAPFAERQAASVRGAAPFATLASVAAMHYDVWPVTSDDATGGERFEIRTGDLDQLARSDFPFALLGGGHPRPTVELLNGVGVAGLTQQVARIVVPAGGHVTLTNNVEGFNQHVTRIVYYDPDQYATAQRFARVVGAKSVVRGAISLDSVDITVVIGSDFVKAHR